MNTQALNSAINAIKSGNKPAGQQLLTDILKSDPHNEIAWLWLSTCLDNNDKKMYCLKKALSINPNNQNTIKAISQLETLMHSSVESPITGNTEQGKNILRERKKTDKTNSGDNNLLEGNYSQTTGARIVTTFPTKKATTVKEQKISIWGWIIIGTISVASLVGLAIIGVSILNSLFISTSTPISTKVPLCSSPHKSDTKLTNKTAYNCPNEVQRWQDDASLRLSSKHRWLWKS